MAEIGARKWIITISHPLLGDRADRHVDRQRLAPPDDGQPRSDARRDRLGRHGVRGRQRDRRNDGELVRHVFRQAKLLRGVDRALHDDVVLLRIRFEHLGARLLPLRARPRGGALLSTSQSILVETFPPEELGFATSLFGMGIVVGPTIGPTLGDGSPTTTRGRGSST
jgi:hypothetical protein